MTKVAIQGYEGSFHHEAALHFFGKGVAVIPCDNFRDLVNIVKDCDAGVMAIENSIAGSILPNYHLLQRSKLHVTGEIYLSIKQQLLVNHGIRLEDIREVHSHPMAIQQCLEFLEKYPWKLIETEDTALSAKHIQQHRSKHHAAIAGKAAAELYDLEIIAPNIHTMKSNYTRFLVIEREASAESKEAANKASLNFQTDHSKGSLARVLTIIAEGGINLSKLQSLPIPGTDFKYSFHADMEFDSLQQFEKVILDMKPLTEGINIYGIYKKGLWK